MATDNEVANVVTALKQAVSSALNETQERLTIEVKELTRIGQAYSVIASFKVAPLFVLRTGTIIAALIKTEKGFEITSLKIEDKGL